MTDDDLDACISWGIPLTAENVDAICRGRRRVTEASRREEQP
jgi:hypothetical protein